MGRGPWLSVVLAALLSSPAAAYELRWDGRAPAAYSKTAQVCTLSVWTTTKDCPLRSGTAWHLVWANQEPGVAPTFLSGASPSDLPLAPEYRFGDVSAGLGGQVDTLVQSFPAEHCPAPVGRFQFTFPPDPRATVILIVEDTASTPVARIVAALSIGDGSPIPPPPQITRGSVSDVGVSSGVVVDGVSLEGVRRAYWIGESRSDTMRAIVGSSAPN